MRKKINSLIVFILSYFVGYHLVYPNLILKLINLTNNFISTNYFSTKNYSTFSDRLIFSIAFSFFFTILFSKVNKFKQKITILLFVLLFYILRFSYLKIIFKDIDKRSSTTDTFWIGDIMLISLVLLILFTYFKNRTSVGNKLSLR